MTDVDITGIDTLGRLDSELAAKGITLVLAGRQVEFEQWLKATKHPDEALQQRAFPTMRQAVRHWRGRDGSRVVADEAEDTGGVTAGGEESESAGEPPVVPSTR